MIQSIFKTGCLVTLAFTILIHDLRAQDSTENNTLACSIKFQEMLINLAKRDPDIHLAETSMAWFQLIDLSRQSDCQDKLSKQLQNWQRRHPRHLALKLLPELFDNPSVQSSIKQIALILPMTGKFAGQADIFYQSIKKRADRQAIELSLYDSEQTALQNIDKSIKQSAAECVIGPLTKEKVLAYNQLNPSAFTMMLNYLPEDQTAPPWILQVSLAPENQAISLAAILKQKHLHNGVMLFAKSNDWVARSSSALYQAFKIEDGIWQNVLPYFSDLNSQTEAVKKALEVDQSLARAQKLESLLGEKIVSLPRRRSDTDFIVLIGQRTALKHLHAQLRYWGAHDLPVYFLTPELTLGNQSLEYDLDNAATVVPKWLKSDTKNVDYMQNQSLDELGKFAFDLAVKSHCYQPDKILQSATDFPNWNIDFNSGKINYLNTEASILNNTIKQR